MRAYLALCLGSLLFLTGCWKAADQPVRWTMINVNNTDLQADAHLLEFTSGKLALIDAGHEDDRVSRFLKEKGIRSLDWVFISHPHKDHYGGLPFLVSAGIELKEVRFNLPDRQSCDVEIPWGCDFEHVQKTREALLGHGIPVRPLLAGDAWSFPSQNASLEVLYAFDTNQSPIGKLDINDTSVLMRLTVGKQRVLFTGDLNLPLGDYLAKHATNLAANILKVPHHGTASLAPNAFFDAVSPSLAMVPSPRFLWDSPRSKQAREYFKAKKTPVFVSGFCGHVEILLGQSSFTAIPQYPGL
jgi:competence protein ComEC